MATTEKTIKARYQQKHDIEANWLKATNFIPKNGEIIIYDIDDTHSAPRMKIGNGEATVNTLPFLSGASTYPLIVTVNNDNTASHTTDYIYEQANLGRLIYLATNSNELIPLTQIDNNENIIIRFSYITDENTVMYYEIQNEQSISHFEFTNVNKQYVDTAISQCSQVQIFTWEEND